MTKRTPKTTAGQRAFFQQSLTQLSTAQIINLLTEKQGGRTRQQYENRTQLLLKELASRSDLHANQVFALLQNFSRNDNMLRIILLSLFKTLRIEVAAQVLLRVKQQSKIFKHGFEFTFKSLWEQAGRAENLDTLIQTAKLIKAHRTPSPYDQLLQRQVAKTVVLLSVSLCILFIVGVMGLALFLPNSRAAHYIPASIITTIDRAVIASQETFITAVCPKPYTTISYESDDEGNLVITYPSERDMNQADFVVFEHYTSYRGDRKYGFKTWLLQDAQHITEVVEKLSERAGSNRIDWYDFETAYTDHTIQMLQDGDNRGCLQKPNPNLALNQIAQERLMSALLPPVQEEAPEEEGPITVEVKGGSYTYDPVEIPDEVDLTDTGVGSKPVIVPTSVPTPLPEPVEPDPVVDVYIVTGESPFKQASQEIRYNCGQHYSGALQVTACSLLWANALAQRLQGQYYHQQIGELTDAIITQLYQTHEPMCSEELTGLTWASLTNGEHAIWQETSEVTVMGETGKLFLTTEVGNARLCGFIEDGIRSIGDQGQWRTYPIDPYFNDIIANRAPIHYGVMSLHQPTEYDFAHVGQVYLYPIE